MTKSEIYADIYRAYDRDKSDAEKAALQRRDYLYKKEPRLKEIQQEMDNTGIRLAEIFVSGGDKEKQLAKYREEVNKLKAEKNSILNRLGYASDYMEPHYKCKKCNDTGYIENKRCSCFKSRLIRVYYDMSNISAIVKEENFENFNINLYDDKTFEDGVSARDNIRSILLDVISKVDDIEKTPVNIVFTGRSGLGKTYMCNCIAKMVIDMGLSVIYMTAYELMESMIKHRFSNSEDNDGYNLLKDCDMLIIDDLGTEGINAGTTAELFNIINARYLEGHSTIISTNMTLVDINSVYSERIASRILGNYKCYRFFGKDLRIFK